MTALHTDPYRTLGLRPGASAAEVRGAYRRLVRTLHPDAGAGAGSADRLVQVVAARRALEPLLRAPAAPSHRHVDVYA